MNPKNFHLEDCKGKEKDLNRMRRYVNYKPQLLRNENFTNKVIKHMIAKNHFECFKIFITYEDTRLNSTVMWYAVEAESIEFLEYLTGFEIDDLDMDKCLRIASHVLSFRYEHQFEKMKLLIDYGVIVDHPVEPIGGRESTFPIFCNMSPIVKAIRHPKIFKLLLFEGVRLDSRGLGDDIDNATKDCFSLIHHVSALSWGENLERTYQLIDMIHKLGGNLWQKNRNNYTVIETRNNSYIWDREYRLRVIHALSGANDREPHEDDDYSSYDENTDPESGSDIEPDVILYKFMPRGVNKGRFDAVTKKIQELMETPISLMCHCRISLMKLFGSDYMEKTELLRKHLPEKIVSFLQGSDLPANEA